MATYKVIQDIEAEDKLVGPLTLKQFIFAAIAACFCFVAFMVASKTVIYAAIPFLPFILLFGIMAAPLGRDQPSDLWLAAQIRFFLKPRKRIWDQSGIKELVNVTAPKKTQVEYASTLSQQEVKSRLKALADTIDSRGWAVKDVAVNMYATPALVSGHTDRLIDLSNLPQSVPDIDIDESDDIMDNSSVVSQHFDAIVQKTTQNQRESAIARMRDEIQNNTKPRSAASPAATTPLASDYQNRLTNSKNQALSTSSVITDSGVGILGKNPVQPQLNYSLTEQDEQELLDRIKAEKQKARMTMPHHKVIETPEEIAREQTEQAQAVTPQKYPDIVKRVKDLANNSDDLSVASVAHLANRISRSSDNKEIVIKLR